MFETLNSVLVVAPHPDDETLGCGGTIRKLVDMNKEVYVLTIAVHAPPLFPPEAADDSKLEAKAAYEVLGVKDAFFVDRPACFVQDMPHHELNGVIHSTIGDIGADAVFIPYLDRMVDHKAVFESAMVATRPVGNGERLKLVLAYEVISETHWTAPHLEANFTPNFFVDITDTIDTKLDAMRCYKSKLHPFPKPRSLEALKALALFRGSVAGCAYAEGFQTVRALA